MESQIENLYILAFKFQLKRLWKEYQIFMCKDASIEGSISTGEVDDSAILEHIRSVFLTTIQDLVNSEYGSRYGSRDDSK